MRVLLVEDERILRVSLAKELAKAGHVVEACDRGVAGLAALAAAPFDVILADIRLPGMDGFELMEEASRLVQGLPFVFMTAFGTVRDAVRAMRLGAYDYLTKPFEVDELLILLDRIRSARSLRDENAELRRRVEQLTREDELGSSAAMRRIRDDLSVVAGSDETVLITGETGTGKEYLARLIHARSRRAEGPFVQVSCAALTRGLIESELFGHEKGAFTGANERHVGRFERASGGTLLLDEIDDVPLPIQVKLLQVLQSATIERVGGQRTLRVDVRVIAATKVDLAAEVRRRTFREDLYYRLNVLPIQLPPLRQRTEDIPRLLERFLQRAGRPISVTPAALEELMAYAWPGNIRELENLTKRLVVHVPEGTIDVETIPLHLRHAVSVARLSGGGGAYEETMRRCEHELLAGALERAGGNRSRAAEELGMAASTFRDRLVKLGMTDRGTSEE